MSQHAERRLTPARLILGFAAAVLLALVGWIVIRSGDSGSAAAQGDPLIVQPSAADLQPVENHIPLDQPLTTASIPPGASLSPSASVSVSAPASRSASASPSASKSTGAPSPSVTATGTPAPAKSSQPPSSPQPEKSTAAQPTRTTSSPQPVDVLVASYANTAVWRDGFIGSVRVVNTGSSTRDFAVTVSFPSASDIRVWGAWNGSASGDDNRVTVRGTLAAGASVTAGFQAAKDRDDSVRSATCSVGGGTCRVS